MRLNATAVAFMLIEAALSTLPLHAQTADQPGQPSRQRSSLPEIGRPYSIRVTTTSHTNAGWEKSLTDKNPGLSHWTWVPVTNYDQGYLHKGEAAKALPTKPAAPQRPASVYSRPVRVPLPRKPAGVRPLAMRVPLPRNPAGVKPRTPAPRTAGHSRSVSGPLVAKTPLPPQEVKSYRGSYSNLSGRIKATRVAKGDQTTVFGKLYSPLHSHTQ